MKNWIYAALAAFLATGCAPHGGYTLTGEVPEAWEGKPVVLFTTDTGQAEAIDSTTVANGKFRLQGVLDAPRNCRVAVYLDPQDRTDRNLTVTFPVFLDSTAVNAVCDAAKGDPVFTLTGGATQTEWQAYRAALEPLAKERERAFDEYIAAFYYREDGKKGVELARRVDEKAGHIRDFKIAYVREHPASAVSLAIVQELCDRQSRLDKAQMESLLGALTPQLRESAAGRYTEAGIQGKRIVEGQPLPDLELPDAEGIVRRVSDFIRPGHYTLVEIWASWCMPCRGEIPFVRRAYEKYHRKGFDVLYVSIDSDAANWKRALDEEKMPWPQLLDTGRTSFSAYETTAVPTSILVDGEGRICRLNARGGWLDGVLEEIYGK